MPDRDPLPYCEYIDKMFDPRYNPPKDPSEKVIFVTPIPIVLCMGSSCFARGNQENLEELERFLAARGLTDAVDLRGSRCEGACALGPNIRIGRHTYHGVTPGSLRAILERELTDRDGD